MEDQDQGDREIDIAWGSASKGGVQRAFVLQILPKTRHQAQTGSSGFESQTKVCVGGTFLCPAHPLFLVPTYRGTLAVLVSRSGPQPRNWRVLACLRGIPGESDSKEVRGCRGIVPATPAGERDRLHPRGLQKLGAVVQVVHILAP